jgi:RecB family endonuclease NucS
MRLIVARCEVRYSGRLTAVLPMALRLAPDEEVAGLLERLRDELPRVLPAA